MPGPIGGYGVKQRPMYRALLRVAGYLVLSDGEKVGCEQLEALLAETAPQARVRFDWAVSLLRQNGLLLRVEASAVRLGPPWCRSVMVRLADGRTRLARSSTVRLFALPPDELLEPILAAIDELRLTGHEPRHWTPNGWQQRESDHGIQRTPPGTAGDASTTTPTWRAPDGDHADAPQASAAPAPRGAARVRLRGDGAPDAIDLGARDGADPGRLHAASV